MIECRARIVASTENPYIFRKNMLRYSKIIQCHPYLGLNVGAIAEYPSTFEAPTC